MMNVAALMGMGMAIIAIVGIVVIACYVIFSVSHRNRVLCGIFLVTYESTESNGI